MLKQHPSLIKQLIALTDTVLITVSFVVAYQMASQWDPLNPIESYWVMYVGPLFFYLYVGWTNSLYSVLHFGWMQGLTDRIVVIFALAGVLGASILYLMPDDFCGRRLYLAFGWLSFLLVGAEKIVLREFFVVGEAT